jgi:peptidoglycan/xylan/chitin deacetylase (PgdA/CDA1 family)
MGFKGRLSRLARPRVLSAAAAAAAVAVAVATVVFAQPGSQRRGALTVDPSTTTAPSAMPSWADPSTTDTTFAEPADTEPLVAPTTGAPEPTPILISNSIAAPVFYRLHLSSPVVFVTIDDGWVQDPRVITFLRQSGWPVTVFLIERAALKNPSYFRQLSAAGATIEDHTYDHPYLTSLSAGGQSSEICRPAHDYAGLVGNTPTLLRPPYGAWNPTTQSVAHACGLAAVVEWSATMSAGHLAVAGPRLRGGDIILLHFTSTLYSDLVALRGILAADHLSVGRLESYLISATSPSASGPSAAGPTTTSSTTTSGSTTTTSTVTASPSQSPTTTAPSTTATTSTPPTT